MRKLSVPTGLAALVAAFVCGAALLPTSAMNLATANGKDGEKNELHDIMEELGPSFRDLRRSVRSPEKAADTLSHLQEMQELSVRAKAIEPQDVAEKADDNKSQMMRAYQLQMVALLEKLLATERAVLEERHDDAATLVKEIYILQRDAHREFRVEDD
jgi:hypothetical protein